MVLAKLPEYISKVARFDSYISTKLRSAFNVTESEFPSVIDHLIFDVPTDGENHDILKDNCSIS